jgi:outer membrane protein insertion porin family
VLTYGRNFGLFGSGSISYTRSESQDRLFYTGPLDVIVEQSYDISNSSIQPVYTFDSRDSRLETTRGWNLVGSLEYAGGFLGGDNYFWRPEVHLSRFQPVTNTPIKTLVALNLEAGLVSPFDGREVVPLERYYMGGENSVRGFQFRSIYVTDEVTGLPVLQDGYFKGGDKFVQLNLELHVLIGGPFRMILFADGGNVYDDDQSIDFSRLRTSAGGELRIFVPIFGAPLRFIYSKNLDPKPLDLFESFQFSIGATF